MWAFICAFPKKIYRTAIRCPYDNAVAEATYKIFKTEFVMNKTFDSLDQLKFELADYVHWFNNFRIHGSLGYLSPVQFKACYSAK